MRANDNDNQTFAEHLTDANQCKPDLLGRRLGAIRTVLHKGDHPSATFKSRTAKPALRAPGAASRNPGLRVAFAPPDPSTQDYADFEAFLAARADNNKK